MLFRQLHQMKTTRRTTLKKISLGAALVAFPSFTATSAISDIKNTMLKGNIKHSVCRWCFGDIAFEELCRAAKEMGISSIELAGPEEWPILKKHGLHCAMPWTPNSDLSNGFNQTANHEKLINIYTEFIPKVAAAGYNTLICFSGNKFGISAEQGLENCAVALRKLIPLAEKHNVTLVMELLNSKVDHKDYQCDSTAWGVKLCKLIGSDRFKLLYDIYHMQIMEGDIIRTIRENIKYIAHFHTGGNPGRHEIDETQELYYPAIMKAILETGFKGYVAQEFIPTKANKLEALKQGITICDV